MGETIHYPVKGRKLEDAITQQTLDSLVAQLEAWQQGPGVFGRLHLHSCWCESSVLDRGYQGESVSSVAIQMRTARLLYAKTGNVKWRVLENAMAAHLLYLQDESGGFIHARGEFEPSFDTWGCPIHWFYPVLGLCEYYQWEYADESIKALIPAAIDRQWEWSLKNAWKRGNDFQRPLVHPGWCGVTNQDLVAIAAITMSVKLFGREERYAEYARPALDHLLSPAYYHETIGLFERGDRANFAERTVYYNPVLEMLQILYGLLGEQRLLDAYDNVVEHLFDALFEAEDGLTYLARGALTDPQDKTKVLGWEYGAIAFEGYPSLILYMTDYLKRHPSEARSRQLEALKDTVAAYLFVDGGMPMGIFNPDPLFTVASTPDTHRWIALAIEVLGDKMVDPRPVELPCIHRIHNNIIWKQKGRLWAVEADGVRQYGGYTRYPAGVVQGPDAAPVHGNFDELEQPDYIEIVD